MGGHGEEVNGKVGQEKRVEKEGSPISDEFARNFYLYAVFNGAAFMLKVVNKLEQTFARSLIQCEMPIDPNATFTGSAWCGDRLLVIDQGQTLSSRGQGMECFFKVVAMVFLAILADVVGRKPVLVIGIACTGISALCFLSATASPTWLAYSLFALGQGLQGAYPAELLAGIVVNDLSSEEGTDLVVVNQVQGTLALFNIFVTECLGAWLNSSTSADFATTWALVALSNATLAMCAWKFARETKPKFDVDRTSKGILAGVKDEFHEYGALLLTNKMLRLNLTLFAFVSAFFVGMSVDFSFYISYHKVPISSAVLHLFWKFPVGVACFGIADKLCRKFGMKQGFVILTLTSISFDVLLMPFFLASPYVFLTHQYATLICAGLPVISNAVDARWFDQRLTSKFLSMKSLTEYFVGMMVNPVYGAVFDAHATGYFRRMAPYALMFTFKALNFLLMFGPVWHNPEGLPTVLDRIERERALKDGQREAAEPGQVALKSSDEKKTE